MTKRLGAAIALFTTFLTLFTFGIAIFTPPLSGPFCTQGCYDYPYTDIASRFPRDYYWMYPALLLAVVFVGLITCIKEVLPTAKRIFGQLAHSFALLSSGMFLFDYFIQLAVVQPSLLNNEFDGISLISQFNPHGVFIALEELGFLLMSLTFLCLAFAFSGGTLERWLRRLFLSSFILTYGALVYFAVRYGLAREYLFEVATISINWFTLIIGGVLLNRFFSKAA